MRVVFLRIHPKWEPLLHLLSQMFNLENSKIRCFNLSLSPSLFTHMYGLVAYEPRLHIDLVFLYLELSIFRLLHDPLEWL